MFITAERLENVGKWLAILSSASLFVSLIYDYGFYSALRLSFLDVPTQISDHVRSSLVWFPTLLGAALLVLTWELAHSRFKSNSDPDSKNNDSSTAIENYTGYNWVLLLIVFVCVLLHLLLGDVFMGLSPVYNIFFWGVFCRWAFSRNRVQLYSSREIRMLVFLVPVLVIFAFKLGYTKAVLIFHEKEPYSTISRSSGELEKIILLRQIDKGILVSDESKNVKFIQWSEIKEISTIGRYKEDKGILCDIFNRNCGAEGNAKDAK